MTSWFATSRSQASRARSQTARYAGLIGGGLAVSRLFGLLRDVLLAYFLGTGPVAEAWIVASRLLRYLRTFLTEGALNAGLVPVLSVQMEACDRSGARRDARAATSAFALSVLVVATLGVVLAPMVARALAPGFAEFPDKLSLTIDLIRWVFVALLPFAIGGALMAILQSAGYFLSSAVAPALLNVSLIVAIVAICPMFGNEPARWVRGLVVGLLIAAALQILVQLRPLRRHELSFAPTAHMNVPAVRKMARLMGPTLIGVGASEGAVIVNTLLASLLGGGAMAAIEYASRVAAVPQMILGGAIATAMLPILSRQSARGALSEAMSDLSMAVRAVVFVMTPLAVLTAMLSQDLVRLLYERGAFADEATIATARALRYLAPWLVGAATVRVLTAAFLSRQDTRTPARVAVASIVVNVLAALLLMRPMGVGGLALALSLSPCAASVVLITMLSRREGGFPMRRWRRTSAAVVLGSVAAGLSVLAVERWGESHLSATQSGSLPLFAASATAGLVAYLSVAWAARAPELPFAYRLLARRRER